MGMTKSELRELAVWGVRRRLAEMEKVLAYLHEEFPEAFLSATPPQLVKLESRTNGSGWPEVKMLPASADGGEPTKKRIAKNAGVPWTPERRAKQLATFARKRRAIKARKASGGSAAVGRGMVKNIEKHKQAYAYLASTAHGEAQISEIAKGIGDTRGASFVAHILHAMMKRGVAKKIGQGRFALTGKTMEGYQ